MFLHLYVWQHICLKNNKNIFSCLIPSFSKVFEKVIHILSKQDLTIICSQRLLRALAALPVLRINKIEQFYSNETYIMIHVNGLGVGFPKWWEFVLLSNKCSGWASQSIYLIFFNGYCHQAQWVVGLGLIDVSSGLCKGETRIKYANPLQLG